MKITYLNKTSAVDPQNPSIPTEVIQAVDLNEIKASVNALYDELPNSVAVLQITQSGTGNPTIVTLKNTTGLTFTATRNDVGQYLIIPSVSPVVNKLAFFGGTSEIALAYDGDNIFIGTDADGALSSTPIKLEIYP